MFCKEYRTVVTRYDWSISRREADLHLQLRHWNSTTALPSTMLSRPFHLPRAFSRLKITHRKPRPNFTASSKRTSNQLQTRPRRNYSSVPGGPKPPSSTARLPVISLVGIFCLGSLSFYYLVKTREGQGGQSHFNLPPKVESKEQWKSKARES